MDSVPTQTAGTSELLASDWNTYVRDNFDSIKFGHIVCTSSTRPTSIAEGTMIYETDTQKALVYSGASWIEISDLDRAGALPETSPGHLIVADNTAKSALTATEGMMVYQSDNNKVFVYSGSAWVEVNDLDNTGGISTGLYDSIRRLSLESRTTNYTVNQTAPGSATNLFNDISVTGDGVKVFELEVFIPRVTAPAATAAFTAIILWNSTTGAQVGVLGLVQTESAGSELSVPVYCKQYLVVGNGTTAYNIRAIKANVTPNGTVYCGSGGSANTDSMPGYFAIYGSYL